MLIQRDAFSSPMLKLQYTKQIFINRPFRGSAMSATAVDTSWVTRKLSCFLPFSQIPPSLPYCVWTQYIPSLLPSPTNKPQLKILMFLLSRSIRVVVCSSALILSLCLWAIFLALKQLQHHLVSNYACGCVGCCWALLSIWQIIVGGFGVLSCHFTQMQQFLIISSLCLIQCFFCKIAFLRVTFPLWSLTSLPVCCSPFQPWWVVAG